MTPDEKPDEAKLSLDVRHADPAPPHPLVLLERAMAAGLTADNVVVAEKLLQMAREQRAEDAKAAFARAFFQLRKNMPEIYADKEVKTDDGTVAYRSISEEELSKKLEPHLMAFGFAMLFGQSEADGRVTVNITLLHESGHEQTREFTVRSSPPKTRMQTVTSSDTGAATTAWRHLMIKLFGLKSRIVYNNEDIRIEGEFISADKIAHLREQIAGSGATEASYLELAGVPAFEKIGEGTYPVLIRALNMRKRKAGK